MAAAGAAGSAKKSETQNKWRNQFVLIRDDAAFDLATWTGACGSLWSTIKASTLHKFGVHKETSITSTANYNRQLDIGSWIEVSTDNRRLSVGSVHEHAVV